MAIEHRKVGGLPLGDFGLRTWLPCLCHLLLGSSHEERGNN
jgi:hypothetical protein